MFIWFLIISLFVVMLGLPIQLLLSITEPTQFFGWLFFLIVFLLTVCKSPKKSRW